MWKYIIALICMVFVVIVVEGILFQVFIYPALELTIFGELLAQGEMKGRDLRNRLRKLGFRIGLARFYQVMAVLEDHGDVQHRDATEEVEGVEITIRWYRLTEGGRTHHDRKLWEMMGRGVRTLFPLATR